MNWVNIIVVIFCFHLNNGHELKFNVSVYYETLCPHSVRLIQHQILPTWSELKDYLNITFVPYGKASQWRDANNGSWRFECQHGEKECYGNRIQACALHQFKDDQDKSVRYVGCFMVFSNVYPFKNTCFEDYAEKNATRIKAFRECVDTQIGDDILSFYGNLTYDVNPSITTVPTLTFNGEYDYNKEKRSNTNFFSIVCDSLEVDPKPKVCSKEL